MDREKLQERNLDTLIRNGGFEFAAERKFFPYTSGKIGPYYVQSGVVQKNGRDYAEAITSMAKLLQSVEEEQGMTFDLITGGETRDWIFSLPVAAMLKRSHAMLYKDKKIVGSQVAGNSQIAHIADLNNEGSSVRDYWLPTIQKEGGKLEHVFFYVDRMEEGGKVMEELGLKTFSVVKLDENAWNYLQEQQIIPSSIANALVERSRDPEKWARNMLRSDLGFEKLRELYDNPVTRAKAEKIMTVGYPDMEEELRKRLGA